MKGTRKKMLRIIAGLLLAIAIVFVITDIKKVKVTSIKLHPKNEEEDFQYSFYEGAQLGTYNAEIEFLLMDRKITERQYNNFKRLTKNLVFECTLDTLSETYGYAGYLLKQDIEFYYHDNQNMIAYMQGYAVQTNMMICSLYYDEGEISDAVYRELNRRYDKLMENPTKNMADKLLEAIDEAIGNNIIEDELLSSSSIILFLRII